MQTKMRADDESEAAPRVSLVKIGFCRDTTLNENAVKNGEAYLCLADDAPGLATPECMVCPRAHSFTPLISTFAGDGWRKMSEGIFTHVLPAGQNAPDEAGLRIRLSVPPALADESLRALAPILVNAGCPFKVIANTALLELVCSRRSPGKSASDFITVFPLSQELFDELTGQFQHAVQEIKDAFVPVAAAEPSDRAALTPDNPWPGRDAFLPDEQAYFCGREEERLELARRLEQGLLTVVLGAPGVGKTSLLQAGLRPMLDRVGFEPVYLRLHCAGETHPLQQVRDEINRALRVRRIDGAPLEKARACASISMARRRAGLPRTENASCRS
jgi:hypothetical protein